MSNVATKSVKLTVAIVEAELSKFEPGQGRRRIWDATVSGFHLQITPGGTGSYVLRYKLPGSTTPGWLTIGQTKRVPLEAARQKAKEIVSEITLHGTDPMRAKDSAKRPGHLNGTTLNSLSEAYFKNRKVTSSESMYDDEYYCYNKYLKHHVGNLEFDEITRGDVKHTMKVIQREIESRNPDRDFNGFKTTNRAHAVLRRIYTWANDVEITERNPAAFKLMFQKKSPRRVGKLDEVRFATIWWALEASANGELRARVSRTALAVQLFMITLQRPIDIARARVGDFDLDGGVWKIPGIRTKTGDVYTIPLSPMAIQFLKKALEGAKEGYLFPSVERANKPHIRTPVLSLKFRKTVRLLFSDNLLSHDDIKLYDCRKFGRTAIQHTLKFSKDVAERVINHAEGVKMDSLYDVNDYSAEVRVAQLAWSAEVFRMVNSNHTDLERLRDAICGKYPRIDQSHHAKTVVRGCR